MPSPQPASRGSSAHRRGFKCLNPFMTTVPQSPTSFRALKHILATWRATSPRLRWRCPHLGEQRVPPRASPSSPQSSHYGQPLASHQRVAPNSESLAETPDYDCEPFLVSAEVEYGYAFSVEASSEVSLPCASGSSSTCMLSRPGRTCGFLQPPDPAEQFAKHLGLLCFRLRRFR